MHDPQAPALPIQRVTLRGHLDEGSLAAALATVDLGGRCALIVDVLAMTGYDAAARSRFIEWNRASKRVVARVAIVTRRTSWRAVIAAMALASRQRIQAFGSAAAAEAWAARG